MASDAYKVEQYGTDTSGREILMNKRMRAAYQAVLAKLPSDLAEKLVVVQGGYMARLGGGASASAGYHDAGGCIDTRVWNLTGPEKLKVIHAARSVGWAIWERNEQRGGMDPHHHWVLLDDTAAAPGAKWQMSEYRAGRDGLASQGDDYHWRPDPIPTFDYDKWLATEDELSAADVKDVNVFTKSQADRIIEVVRESDAKTREVVGNQIRAAIAGIPTTEGETPAQFKAKVLAVVSDAIKE